MSIYGQKRLGAQGPPQPDLIPVREGGTNGHAALLSDNGEDLAVYGRQSRPAPTLRLSALDRETGEGVDGGWPAWGDEQEASLRADTFGGEGSFELQSPDESPGLRSESSFDAGEAGERMASDSHDWKASAPTGFRLPLLNGDPNLHRSASPPPPPPPPSFLDS